MIKLIFEIADLNARLVDLKKSFRHSFSNTFSGDLVINNVKTRVVIIIFPKPNRSVLQHIFGMGNGKKIFNGHIPSK